MNGGHGRIEIRHGRALGDPEYLRYVEPEGQWPDLRSLTSLWWTTLVRGLCLTVIGLVMFFWPTRSMTLLFQLLGGYWLIGGVFDLVEGVAGRGSRSRLWMILSAVVSMAAGALRLMQGRDGTRTWRSVLLGSTYVALGVIVVAHPFITQALIMLLLSAWAVAAGVLGVFAALSLHRARK